MQSQSGFWFSSYSDTHITHTNELFYYIGYHTFGCYHWTETPCLVQEGTIFHPSIEFFHIFFSLILSIRKLWIPDVRPQWDKVVDSKPGGQWFERTIDWVSFTSVGIDSTFKIPLFYSWFSFHFRYKVCIQFRQQTNILRTRSNNQVARTGYQYRTRQPKIKSRKDDVIQV